jgi:hypothetical protein
VHTSPSITAWASSGVAPGAVPAVAVPAIATLVHPMKLEGGGPHTRQNSSEQVSPEPQRAPEEQHFSDSWPQAPGFPPVVVPVVVVPVVLSIGFVAFEVSEPPHPATPTS